MRTESEKGRNGPQIGVHVSIANRSHGSPEKQRHGLRIRIKYGATHFIYILFFFILKNVANIFIVITYIY